MSKPNAVEHRLLYTRRQAGFLLGGASDATMIRLEKVGKLRPVKLDPTKPNSKVHYTHDNVMQVAKEAADA